MELATRPTDPLALISQAIERGITGDELGKLMSLQERWEANQAAKAFAVAVSGFQADCPPVLKERTASVPTKSGGKFEFGFASFDNVMATARPHLQKWGIAVSFDTDAATVPGKLRVVCNVRVGTHTQSTTVLFPVPVLSTNDTQAFGAAITYGKRYALCAALNIVVTDEDNDASALVAYIGADDVAEVRRIIEKCGVRLDQFLKWAAVESVEDIAAAQLPKVLDMLRRKEREFDATKH